MPIYEYRCHDCDSVFEELVPSSDTPSVACSRCDSAHTERLLSAFAVNTPDASDTSTPRSSPGDADAPTGPCGPACGCF